MSRMSTLSSGKLAMALKQFYRCNKISFTNSEELRVQCKPNYLLSMCWLVSHFQSIVSRSSESRGVGGKEINVHYQGCH